jgi:exo-beta-1,3-glucanase (GH17 family)
MKITKLILFVLLAVAANGLLAWLCNLPQDAGSDVPEGKISSFSFAPFREGQSPLTETFPTTEQIDADLRLLADKTHTIRTYASLGGLKEVPALARKYGLKMIQGAWLGYVTMEKENNAEVQQLIKAANDYPDVIERVIVGNEVLLRGEMKPEQLIQYIRQVKQAVEQPVSYADVWSFYMQYPEIAKEVDFITVHILPYWEDEPLSIENTAAHIEANVRKIQIAYPGKPILIGESGWPSAGRQRGWAVPSVVNEAKFIRSLVQVANKNGFDYNIVEAFNQPWKSKLEGVVGANWGLYSAEREAVFPLTGKVTENPHWPQRVLCAALTMLFAVAWHAKRCLQLSPLRLAGFIGFTQLLAALLVNQAGDLWYTSYSALQRGQSAFLIGLSAALGGLLVRRALELLSAQSGGAALSLWLRYLFLAFVALAVYKSLGLALNGRYLSIPYPLTAIAVAGVLGLAAIRYFTEGRSLAKALEFSELMGEAPISAKCSSLISNTLGFIGLVLIAAETAAIMSGPEYIAAYPLFADRIVPAFMSTLTQSQMLGWAMLLAAYIFTLPFKTVGYTLGFMALAVIAGETRAFTLGHDFIDAHPLLGDRIWTAFVYTIGNCQMLLWLASLVALALPLWAGAYKKA